MVLSKNIWFFLPSFAHTRTLEFYELEPLYVMCGIIQNRQKGGFDLTAELSPKIRRDMKDGELVGNACDKNPHKIYVASIIRSV